MCARCVHGLFEFRVRHSAYIFAERKQFAGRYFCGKIFSREDIFAGRYFRVNSIFAKISSRENISNSLSRKFLPAKIMCYTVCAIGGTCLRRPLGTRRPPCLFENLESYCIKLASLITRYSVLINCAKETNYNISSRQDLQTER